MKRKRNLLVVLLLVCAIGLGVGYAAVATDMSFKGTTKLAPINGEVYFKSAELTKTDAAKSTVAITWTDDQAPTVGTTIKDLQFSISGFDAVDDTATVTAVIKNPHDFAVKITNVATASDFTQSSKNGIKYFSFTDDLDGEEVIAADGELTVKIQITCNATNVTDNAIEDSFKVTFKAEPCENPPATP